MTIDTAKNIFIIGIKGAGMANIALFLQEMGKHVSGSDAGEEFITDENLHKHHIEISNNFKPQSLPEKTDLVIYSGSNGGGENAQVKEAKKRGITVMHQAQLLGQLTESFNKTIAVCGTHGKTTTASLAAYLLIKLGAKPSFIIGAPSFNDVAGGEYQGKDYFVLEADEYALDPPHDLTPKLAFYNPNFIICNSVDYDHPDVYKDIEQTKDQFLKFFKKTIDRSEKNLLFLSADDDNITSLIGKLSKTQFVTYGFSPYANYMVSNVIRVNDTTLFDLTREGVSVGSFGTKLSGDKIIVNVAGVIAMLDTLGFSIEDIHTHLQGFEGAKRRFEYVASVNGIDIYDDYAHHPHEIEATLESARSRFGNRPITVIFQPHTFSRTFALKDDFVNALSKADHIYIAPIFSSSREKPGMFDISSDTLSQMAVQKGIKTILVYKEKEELLSLLKKNTHNDEIILTMGAGDIYKLKDDIIGILQAR